MKQNKFKEMVRLAFHLYGNTRAFNTYCSNHEFNDMSVTDIEESIKWLNNELEKKDME